jgi:hypothetical protein
MSARATRPPSYLTRLLAELDEIHVSYAKVLSASAIRNIDPGPGFIGFPSWGWAKSDAELEASRMALLRIVRGWEPRLRLLFPHPTPTVSKRLDEHLGRLERWLVRKRGEHGIPSTIDKVAEQISADVADLRELARLLPSDDYAVRLAVDTNTLIDNPDLAVHVGTLGRRYMVHLLPVVLREIDDLKRGGKTQQLREAAQRADRRLKGLRDNGDILARPHSARRPVHRVELAPSRRTPRISPLRRHRGHEPPDQARRYRTSIHRAPHAPLTPSEVTQRVSPRVGRTRPSY